MDPLVLHPRLKADTLSLGALTLCQVVLMNDKRFPWVILIPQRQDLLELHDLSESDSLQLIREIRGVSMQMKFYHNAHKINVAALGNLVPQLHIHIVARFETDIAWPKPIWNTGEAIEYSPYEVAVLRKAWEPLLASLKS